MNSQLAGELDYLFSAVAVRERCQQIWQLALQGKSAEFELACDQIPNVVNLVKKEIITNYPDLQVPYHSRWRHFNGGRVERAQQLLDQIADRGERARAAYDLVITSVLLDAGAGSRWSYREESTQQTFSRSEGLAVASYHLYAAGAFAATPDAPYHAFGDKLARFSAATLEKYFQVSANNPLVGVAGRVDLLRRLGETVMKRPDIFGAQKPRLGNLVDYLTKHAKSGTLAASFILKTVLTTFTPIWPGRLSYQGINLGDTWRHPQVQGKGDTAQLVPFHKLSQWLTYSLFEPLEDLGLTITGINELTGLPEYRNGGLFLDGGVLRPKKPTALTQPHSPDSTLIVEWRALTVCLLDRIASDIAQSFGLSQEAFPLAKVLQGGTWSAGREIALTKRAGGEPPIQLASDGTVF